jgi:histone deacetylase complex subunit SAP30
MPPKKQYDDNTQLLKEKLQGASRRNGRVSTTNGSNLKEVDNASTNSGQTSNDSNPSNVSAVT